jgi:CMP/dCMP kinase
MENKQKIITIAGNLGSGKSTAGKAVASLLDYSHSSTGDKMRQMAEDMNVPLNELGKIAERDPSIDKALDDFNIELSSKSNIVVDGRLAWFFIPKSFKVFLKIDPLIAAERILKNKKENSDRHNEDSKPFDSVSDIALSISKRLESEKKRYRDLYKIENHLDVSNYDLVIDTGLPENSIERVPQIIIEEYNNWLKK